MSNSFWLSRRKDERKSRYLERLEDRLVLTTTLFFDFGAGFAAAGIDTTVAEFRDIDGPNTGTNMTNGTNTNPTGMDPAADMNLARINYDFDGNGTPGEVSDVNALSAAVLPLIQRALEPFDILVVGAAASDFTDVQNSFDLNNGDASGEFDAYNFIVDVTSTQLGGGGSGSVGGSYGLFGRAALTDLGAQTGNNTDEATLTFVDRVLASTNGIPGTDAFNANLAQRIAYTAAHEAFHTLSFVHSTGFSGNVAGQTLLTSGDVIRLGSNTREDPFIVTRFDLQRQNGAAVAEPNNYLLAATDPDIGLRDSDNDGTPDLAYISGTGAHDLITLTDNGGGIVGVQIDAFIDAARTSLIASESYTIDLSTDTEGTILIDASINSDQVVIDATIDATIRLRGGTGEDGIINAVDSLLVNGFGLDGDFTPIGSDGGTLNFDSGLTILVSELETAGQIEVDNVDEFTIVFSNGIDVIDVDDQSSATRVDGTINDGVDFVPLELTNVGSVQIDLRNGGDTVTVDTNGGNPIPAGGLSIQGGLGIDTLAVTGTSPTYTPDGGDPLDASRGTLDVDGESIEFTGFEFVTPVNPEVTVLVISDNDINENQSISLEGDFIDPGSLSSHTIVIDWGDGSTDTMISPAVGVREFSANHQYLDDSPSGTSQDFYTITVTITDNDGLDGDEDTNILVRNVAPTVLLDATSPINENDSHIQSGSFTDPGVLDTHELVFDWDDDNNLSDSTFSLPATSLLMVGDFYNSTTDSAILEITGIDLPNRIVSFSLSHQYLDDGLAPGNATSSDVSNIMLVVTDDDLGSGDDDVLLSVFNVAPQITSFVDPAPIDDKAEEGELLTLELDFSDPGSLDVHTVTVDWGDGTIDVVVIPVGDRVAAVNHAYANGGIFPIDVTVDDDDTGSDGFQTTAFVTGVGVLNGELQIVGSAESDRIIVNRVGQNQIRVKTDFIPEKSGRRFQLNEIDYLVAVLCEGDDNMTIAGNVSLDSLIDAGGGDDNIRGGRGSDIILGRDGNDRLLGRGGNDILIGGSGRDVLIGGPGSDLAFGGIFAANDDGFGGPVESFLDDGADLKEVQLIWNDPLLTVEDRADDIGNLDSFYSKLYDDGDVDRITGAAGDDWVLVHANDIVNGFNKKRDIKTEL